MKKIFCIAVLMFFITTIPAYADYIIYCKDGSERFVKSYKITEVDVTYITNYGIYHLPLDKVNIEKTEYERDMKDHGPKWQELQQKAEENRKRALENSGLHPIKQEQEQYKVQSEPNKIQIQPQKSKDVRDKIVIVKHNATNQLGRLEISGIIKNESEYLLKGIEIGANLFDEKGNFITTEKGITSDYMLGTKSGSQSAFKIYVRGEIASKVKKYDLFVANCRIEDEKNIATRPLPPPSNKIRETNSNIAEKFLNDIEKADTALKNCKKIFRFLNERVNSGLSRADLFLSFEEIDNRYDLIFDDLNRSSVSYQRRIDKNKKYFEEAKGILTQAKSLAADLDAAVSELWRELGRIPELNSKVSSELTKLNQSCKDVLVAIGDVRSSLDCTINSIEIGHSRRSEFIECKNKINKNMEIIRYYF